MTRNINSFRGKVFTTKRQLFLQE